ncbi:MAG TPA: NAD(P)/FAD-dependent oxidoreductase [Syntrophales bacterium]|nr:NAD(P)/FAD-dependent oxidoreductase [Syntrophales bacterium]
MTNPQPGGGRRREPVVTRGKERTAVIIGAGPAGLTAALELLERTDIRPVVFESTAAIGGIARTLVYGGNRIDIGPHRFFSKSDRVMERWRDLLPPQGASGGDGDFLVQDRLTRIFHLGKLFDYPVTLNRSTLGNLGPARILKIGAGYARARVLPVKEEKSLEDFFVNRFGRELYRTFFKDYTEKVWGVSCGDIRPEWGAQRVKGLSVIEALRHALRKSLSGKDAVAGGRTETSLIERFFYPRFGAGQMWETAARRIREKGGRIHLEHPVVSLEGKNGRIVRAKVRRPSGRSFSVAGDYFFSSMPVKDLVAFLGEEAPPAVRDVAAGLLYRDLVSVGLLVKKLGAGNGTGEGGLLPDHWIYIQERGVRMGRLQIFNNWGPDMVRDRERVWLGLEYFCSEGDGLWGRPDGEIAALAAEELSRIGLVGKGDVLDGTVIRMPKAYPAYFGTYNRFDAIREFTDRFENLFLIGRNGMHRYNNQDHSMLAAMTAVDNILGGVRSRDNLWRVNTEQEYNETK